MHVSANLIRQTITYLETQDDPMAKMLRDQLGYTLAIHAEATAISDRPTYQTYPLNCSFDSSN